MVGTVCSAAGASYKGPRAHSVLLVGAAFASERLCAIGPTCTASGWLAHRVLAPGVLSCRSPQARSWQLVDEARQQWSSYDLLCCPQGCSAQGSLSPFLSVSLFVGVLLWRLVGPWVRVRMVTGRLCHRQAWSQAGLVTVGLVGHRSGRRLSHRASSLAPQAARWHSALGRSLRARVLTCIVLNLFAQLAIADGC